MILYSSSKHSLAGSILHCIDARGGKEERSCLMVMAKAVPRECGENAWVRNRKPKVVGGVLCVTRYGMLYSYNEET